VSVVHDDAHAARCFSDERIAAVVLAVEESGAWLEITERRGGCGRCAEPGGCGGVALVDWQEGRRFWFPRSQWGCSLSPGQPVWVVTEPRAPLQAAWGIYGWPLLLALVAAWVGQTAAAATLGGGFADAVALLLFAVALAWAWRRAARRVRAVVRVEPR